MLLSERRVGPEKALKSFYDEAVEYCAELDVRWCEELPSDATESSILFVPGHRNIEGFEEKVSRYPDGTMVICAQELCHQVSAVYRFR